MASGTMQGKVKWFYSRAGYGFITVISEEKKGEDIFVHHSSLRCNTEQYKYLVQGEYVNFVITETNDEKHKFQADNVTGIGGGTLMCETRNSMAGTRRGPTARRGAKRTSTDEGAYEEE